MSGQPRNRLVGMNFQFICLFPPTIYTSLNSYVLSTVLRKSKFYTLYIYIYISIYMYYLILGVQCTRQVGKYFVITFTLVQRGNSGSEHEGRCLILQAFSVPSSSRSFSSALPFFLSCKMGEIHMRRIYPMDNVSNANYNKVRMCHGLSFVETGYS